MKNKIRLGIIGGGGDSLIGIVHRIASSMHDTYEIIGGVFNYNENSFKARIKRILESISNT